MEPVLTRNRILIGFFAAAYILGFGSWFISQGNYEFVWYVATMLVIIGIVAGTLRTSQLSDRVLWLLSFWGLLHMLGGGGTHRRLCSLCADTLPIPCRWRFHVP